ncbi:hypothetical protein JCM5296_002151, partial [Sporobolomyces johnsonii]
TSPAGLTAYSRAARLFFRTKSVKDDEDKIAYLGAGLALYPELHNWYLSSAVEHEAKEYETFLGELQRRALPRDYLWEAKGRMRFAKQGDKDYEDWADEMRTEHLSLTDKVLSTREFVECLLFGMDAELSSVLRRGSSLKNTGYHHDDTANIFSPSSSLIFSSPIDYEKFDREARDEWDKIAARRRSNAAQLKSLSKKAGALNLTSSSTSARLSSTSNRPARATPPSVTNANSGNVTPVGRPPKLTELERDWLGATNGCFKCRQSNVNHEARDCSSWAPAGFVVPVPPGWDRSKPVPDAAATAAPAIAGVRAVHFLDDDDIDVPESFDEDSDTDQDG